MDDLGDDDFDLDEVVKFDSQPAIAGTRQALSNHDLNSGNKVSYPNKDKGLIRSVEVQSNTICEDGWGSDDDSSFLAIKEPEFQSTPFPAVCIGGKKTELNNLITKQSNRGCSIQLEKQVKSIIEGPNFQPSQNSFFGEPHFYSTPVPLMQNIKSPSTQVLNQMAPLGPMPTNRIVSQKPTLNSSILDVINKKNQQQSRIIIENRPKARFPGPAGVLNPISEDQNKFKGQQHKVTKQLIGTDGIVAWDQALAKLDLTTMWEKKRMNLQLIKRSFIPGSFRMRVPLLIVGVQKVDYPPVIQEDIRCILQDPTGEVKGCIVKEVITTYGTVINSGSILILRRPSILQDFPTYHVLITVSSLFGVYSPKTGEMKYCKAFNNKDLGSWLSETMDHGDVADVYFEKPKSPVKLFTTASDIGSATYCQSGGGQQFRSPAPNRPCPSFTPQTRYNQPRPPTFAAPRFAAITPNSNRAPVRSVPPSRPSVRPMGNNIQCRQPPPASSSFQLKAPSAVVSTARPAPYNPPPNRAQSTPTSSLHSQQPAQEPPAANEEFLSQFLSGVDTDALFDDF